MGWGDVRYCFAMAILVIKSPKERLETHCYCSSNGDLSLCQILCLYHYPVRSYQH
jgi:hypothetical protein